LFYQTFGLFRLTVPRHALLESVSRRLSQRLVQRWMSKDAKPFCDRIQEWVREQWQRLELGAECLISRIQDRIDSALGKTPEAAFEAILAPVVRGSASGPIPREKTAGSAGASPAPPKPLQPEQLAAVLDAFEELLGRPADDSAETGGSLLQTLQSVTERLASEWSQKLAELPVRLIEDPGYRLAGAEEAIRQMVATLEQTLQSQEALTQEQTRKARGAYERLMMLTRPLPPDQRRPAIAPAEVLELLRAYPRWRYRSLVLQQVAGVLIGLRGHLSDELREVNFCRVRLGELFRLLEEPPQVSSGTSWQGTANRPSGIGRKLFLGGCRDLPEAIEQFLNSMTPENLLELDGQVQAMLRSRFTALVHVCMTSHSNVLKKVEEAMRETVRAFAAACLPSTTVAELFFQQYPEDTQADEEISSFYDEAAPELSADNRSPQAGPPVGELCVLAAPAGDASDQFCAAVQRLLPDAEIIPTASADDIVVYRERLNLSLANLEQLGPLGQDAYRQMTTTDHFTPHTRSDVDFR
jgi:hypothetical protein